MYRSNIGISGAGFTNQIFNLISGIIFAYNDNSNVFVVGDGFLNDFDGTEHTPINNIFNVPKLNEFLIKECNLVIIDKNNIDFEIISASYGIDEKRVDLTEIIKNMYTNKLFIDKNIKFNDLRGDPCVNVVKKFNLIYRVNEYYIEKIYNENLDSDIIIDFEGDYISYEIWINNYASNKLFNEILKKIEYTDDFVSKSQIILNKINLNKINVIHLSLEDDLNYLPSYMSQDEYRELLESKYIDIITRNLSTEDEIIILASSLSNNVIRFLENNYKYIILEKFFKEKEKNAIIDLLVSKHCNNIFIGSEGSTFSYYISQCINCEKIFIDLNRIHREEISGMKEILVENSFLTKEEVYLKQQKKVCFIHSCYIKELGIDILKNLLDIVHSSGLSKEAEIIVLNVGDPIDIEISANVVQISSNVDVYELLSINYIREYCEKNYCLVLYIHTKGLTHLHNADMLSKVNDWTNMMVYFLVERYKECFRLLKTYDVVGCNFGMLPLPHYSGNFWWSSSNHIRKLNLLDLNPSFIPDGSLRHMAEWWLFTQPPNYYCVHYSSVNHYLENYPREKYQICN